MGDFWDSKTLIPFTNYIKWVIMNVVLLLLWQRVDKCSYFADKLVWIFMVSMSRHVGNGRERKNLHVYINLVFSYITIYIYRIIIYFLHILLPSLISKLMTHKDFHHILSLFFQWTQRKRHWLDQKNVSN